MLLVYIFVADKILPFNDLFTLDLNKRFLQMDRVRLVINGAFHGECLGNYKDKLTSSDNYPIFSSYSKKLKFELFENMNLTSGLQIKGNKSFFKNCTHYNSSDS